MVTIECAQLCIAQSYGLAHLGLAPVTVQIGGDDQALPGQGIKGRHHSALATRQDIAWRITRPAQSNPVGIGQGGHRGQTKRGARGQSMGQPFCLGPDPVDHLAAQIGALTLTRNRGHPQVQVHRTRPAQRIAFRQKCCQRGGLRARTQQHMAKARMQGQGGQGAAMRGDRTPGIQCPQVRQQCPRPGQGCRRRWGQKGQIGRSPKRQFQRQSGQIGLRHFGGRKSHQSAVFAAGPQPVTDAGGDAPSAPGALGGLGPADLFRDQPGHPRAGIKPGAAGQPCVDHHPDILDRQGCFGDGRGQNDLAPLDDRRNRGPLGSKGHCAEQWAKHAIGGQTRGQKPLDPANFSLARQEYQQAAGVFGKGLQNHVGDSGFQSGLLGQGPVAPADIDRKSPPLGGDDGRIQHQRHRRGIQRG